ncbi:TRAP transporter small permease [Billgrantia montanilacus]|uniref:TRAP transporter small permease protein n=1 Tax=Billgrantia montanilacus TaxID=2282305 RepID=A0A368TVF7_9GAMM|nr:TRAP transporter small permease subunit [Halomonas montanilacus]RCV88628.1 TRAP transporter small permease [Halomonas montanilacus]
MNEYKPIVGRAVTWLTQACLGVAMVLLVLIAVLIVTQVVARNLFDTGLPRVDEAARFAGIAMVYLAAPFLLLRGQHVAVTLLVELLPRLGRRLCLVVGELATLGFCVLTLYGFYRFLLRAGRFATPAMGMPNLWFYMPALVGLIFLAVVAAYRLGLLASGREVEE